MALTSPPPLTVLRMGIVNFMYHYSSAGNIKICLWKKIPPEKFVENRTIHRQ